ELWQGVTLEPPDGIFAIKDRCDNDTFPQKIDLSIGAYRGDDAKPWVLPAVRKAFTRLVNDPLHNYEYLPVSGHPEFTKAAAVLLFGEDSLVLKQNRVATVQTISGTGANYLGALFTHRYYRFNGDRKMYVSDPTWVNHHAIFKGVGLGLETYPYYNPVTNRLDFGRLLTAFQNAPNGSVMVLHACAHNPTGVDPTRDQWSAIADVMVEKGHFAFFDCAYQGFASGDPDEDAWAVREFVRRSIPVVVCQSFSKNVGLYAERVGALHVVCPTSDCAFRVWRKLSSMVRAQMSTPPAHGARLVSLILNDPELFAEWKRNVKAMAKRIIEMRVELHRLLTEELKTPGSWEHIVDQIGMFGFTGISEGQAMALTERAHVYMLLNGRISIAGLNRRNIRYFAQSLDRAMRGQL
ncbi:aspartate aminotransferase, partial [Thelephora ganbajun]